MVQTRSPKQLTSFERLIVRKVTFLIRPLEGSRILDHKSYFSRTT